MKKHTQAYVPTPTPETPDYNAVHEAFETLKAHHASLTRDRVEELKAQLARIDLSADDPDGIDEALCVLNQIRETVLLARRYRSVWETEEQYVFTGVVV